MDDVESLRRAFEGAYGVFSVQNGLVGGFDREVVQGRNVADVANHVGVAHLVYASAGTGQRGTGIASWEAKLDIEDHMRGLGLPLTSLRPEAFMELMTDKSYYPAVGTWRIWPRISGENKGIAWMAVKDVGVVAASVFGQPESYIGRSLTLVADVKSLAECRDIYHDVMGKPPVTFPLPVWLFDRFTRGDVTAICAWVKHGRSSSLTGPHPCHPSRRPDGQGVDGPPARKRESTRSLKKGLDHASERRAARDFGAPPTPRGTCPSTAIAWPMMPFGHAGGTHA